MEFDVVERIVGFIGSDVLLPAAAFLAAVEAADVAAEEEDVAGIEAASETEPLRLVLDDCLLSDAAVGCKNLGIEDFLDNEAEEELVG